MSLPFYLILDHFCLFDILGPNHPDTAHSLYCLAELYQAQGNYAEAEPLYQRALTIYQQILGPEHPKTVSVLEGYTMLLQATNRGDETVQDN
jgi:tetratricopeptide (TPR) repeat protein